MGSVNRLLVHTWWKKQNSDGQIKTLNSVMQQIDAEKEHETLLFSLSSLIETNQLT